MDAPLSYWLAFNFAVVVLLGLDLTLLQRGDRSPSFAASIFTTLGWVGLSLGFGGWVVVHAGADAGTAFFTGYAIEYALSVDNLFLFALIFSSFRVAEPEQRRLLLWGVVGALLMRGAMIGAGVALLARFEWILYVFGAYILYAGISMLRHRPAPGVEQMRIVQWARRFLPLAPGPHGGRFIVRDGGRVRFTLLFLVLIVVELTDLVFALDSIPAVFGVTRDPFLVYTSNVCAVLGLRSLYFVLARLVRSLVYLHVGLAAILIFIGAKMLVDDFVPIPTWVSLLVVGGVLAISVVASLLFKPRT
jgi:tellurite resistance protein TerC